MIAYAVRPEADLDEELTTAIKCIREQSLDGFADAAVIVTERFITKARMHNAGEILDAREQRNEVDVSIAAAFVQRFRGAVMLHDIVEALGLGPRGRVATICLIDDGILEFVNQERLVESTLLRPTFTRSDDTTTRARAA